MAKKHYCASVLWSTAQKHLFWGLGGLAAAAVFRLLAGDLNFTPGYTTRAEGQSYATMIAFAFCSLIFGIVCLILALITPFRRESHPFTRVLRRYCPDLPARALFAQVDADLNEYGTSLGGGAAVVGRQWLFLAPLESWAAPLEHIHCAAWQGERLLLGLTGGSYADLGGGRLNRRLLTELLSTLQARRPDILLWSSALELDHWRRSQCR